MNKLGDRNYALISSGVKMTGTFDPDETFPAFIEQLYESEIDEIYAFMSWCHDSGKTFGHGNYEERFTEFKGATT